MTKDTAASANEVTDLERTMRAGFPPNFEARLTPEKTATGGLTNSSKNLAQSSWRRGKGGPKGSRPNAPKVMGVRER